MRQNSRYILNTIFHLKFIVTNLLRRSGDLHCCALTHTDKNNGLLSFWISKFSFKKPIFLKKKRQFRQTEKFRGILVIYGINSAYEMLNCFQQLVSQKCLDQSLSSFKSKNLTMVTELAITSCDGFLPFLKKLVIFGIPVFKLWHSHIFRIEFFENSYFYNRRFVYQQIGANIL